ncbi:MAG: VWA-like domain-containing protein, partial [Dysosmobacter sp.]|nr:VWA-like domain-containing protein [Dysosmobacter sp.]
LVRQFLACTYAILRSTETFTRKVNIRILQCDDQVRSDTPIHDLEELKADMENFQLVGGSATDFRPVFEHVAELQVEGAFTSLRGLVYFTDGMGVYPRKRPPYDTAFVLLEEPPLSVKMPPWAIRLVVPTPALEQAAREAAEEAKAAGLDLIDLDELPQL